MFGIVVIGLLGGCQYGFFEGVVVGLIGIVFFVIQVVGDVFCFEFSGVNVVYFVGNVFGQYKLSGGIINLECLVS